MAAQECIERGCHSEFPLRVGATGVGGVNGARISIRAVGHDIDLGWAACEVYERSLPGRAQRF